MTTEVYAAVADALRAGLCVVPPRQDGSKRPIGAWKQFQTTAPSIQQMRDWYGKDGYSGIGLLTGAVSGIEMLEFEGRAIAAGLLTEFKALAEATGLGELVGRIGAGYTETTPGGGHHWIYRVDRPLGNTQLARRSATADELTAAPDDKIKVLIETRGEGGFVITAPSNGKVHPDGGRWTLTAGGFGSIATVTADERDSLFDLCRTFDQMPVEPPRTSGPAGSDRPGDRYNARADIQGVTLDLLLRHGWTQVRMPPGVARAGVEYLRRPGKQDPGHSATLGHVAPGVLYVFSTSTEFDALRPLDPFGIYVRLEHGGDFGAAARALEPPIQITGAAPADAEAGTGGTQWHAVPPAHLTRQSRAAWYFAKLAGDRVRFDHGRGRWLVWAGHRWRPDEDGSVSRLWLNVLAKRYAQALRATDDATRLRMTEAVQTAGATNAAIGAGLDIASSMEPIATTSDAWDPDPWLIGCDNGVVDLRTGDLRTGRPTDMISRSTGVAYDPDATCPRWMQFLAEVFAGDRELVDWYQMLIGTSLVGEAQEVLAIHHGFGNNGKSVAVLVLRRAFGDYAAVVAVETLVNAKRAAGEATPDLMALRGARIAFASEPDQAAKLRGGVLKRLASVDRMTGRSLYGTTQTWDPTHTMHLATNHLPAVDDATDGFWRRVALVPWPVHFRKPGEDGDAPPEDPTLAATLALERPGILAWAVRGAVAYASGRMLHPFPKAVRVRTDTYRAEEDRLAPFVTDRVVYGRGESVTVGALFAAYRDWCEASAVPSYERLSRKALSRQFEERGHGVGRGVDTTKRVILTGARLTASTNPEYPEYLTPITGSPITSSGSRKVRNMALNTPDTPESGVGQPDDLVAEAIRIFGDDLVDPSVPA